ncbi:hypothetical protein GIB67_003946 [Kingdonia uniflora]|uniref:O-fucosyltransferase family protein n=1 Tax=Kingdonia uniflora TaxID=39325 RepID=A0A7J7LXA8_9MAGN|nr:hypothetical protein GIB67_003946 [Kingdonia uniflora]
MMCIVSYLPSTHLMSRPVEEKRTPPNESPRWNRESYLKRLKRDGVLLLRGSDSRLSKDIPSDLQKLRCKRMRSKGPDIALYLQMEKDVWVRTECLPGLSHKYDEIIRGERKLQPELLTGRSNMTSHDRKLAGLCPLNTLDVTRYKPVTTNFQIYQYSIGLISYILNFFSLMYFLRLLKALRAPRKVKIYIVQALFYTCILINI